MEPVTNCKRAFKTGVINRKKHNATMKAIRKTGIPPHVRNENSVVGWTIYPLNEAGV